MEDCVLFCHADTVNFANTPQKQGRPVPLRAMAPVTKGLGGLRVSGDGSMRADCFRKEQKGRCSDGEGGGPVICWSLC